MAKDKKGKEKTSTGKTDIPLNSRTAKGGPGNFLKSILSTISGLLNSLLGLKKKNKISFLM